MAGNGEGTAAESRSQTTEGISRAENARMLSLRLTNADESFDSGGKLPSTPSTALKELASETNEMSSLTGTAVVNAVGGLLPHLKPLPSVTLRTVSEGAARMVALKKRIPALRREVVDKDTAHEGHTCRLFLWPIHLVTSCIRQNSEASIGDQAQGSISDCRKQIKELHKTFGDDPKWQASLKAAGA